MGGRLAQQAGAINACCAINTGLASTNLVCRWLMRNTEMEVHSEPVPEVVGQARCGNSAAGIALPAPSGGAK